MLKKKEFIFELDLTNENIYTYFIDNRRILNHQSVTYGLRELNSVEIKDYCSNTPINNSPIFNEPFNFSSDYELRIYMSGCSYLDANNRWQSDGLWVSLNKILFSDLFLRCSGRSKNKSISNTMLLHSFDYICK